MNTKSEFLGEPYSTARARLGKMLLFKMLLKLGPIKCFRCSNDIETVEELSVDHKEPWLYVSKDLFWDLDNVDFSHILCNTGASRYNPQSAIKKRKVGPIGTGWCPGHQEFLSVEKFSKGPRWDGLHWHCKECRSTKKHPNRVGK